MCSSLRNQLSACEGDHPKHPDTRRNRTVTVLVLHAGGWRRVQETEGGSEPTGNMETTGTALGATVSRTTGSDAARVWANEIKNMTTLPRVGIHHSW